MYGHLNAKYADTKSSGTLQTIAKLVNPEVAKLYRASKNKRKSKTTLPPCSWVYVLNALVIISHAYFQQQLIPSERFDIQSY